MKKTGLFFIGLLLFAGCDKSVPTQKVVIEDRYSIEIPSFLTKTMGLNDEASMQYKSDSLNFFVIIIDEKKEDVYSAFRENNMTEKYSSDFNGYCNLIFNSNSESIESAKKSAITASQINKMPAKKMSVEGKFNGIGEFVYIGLIEGKDSFYQIMTWVHLEQKDEYKKVMDKMMDSFVEIENSPAQ